MVKDLSKKYRIIFVSGRMDSDNCRDDTISWIKKHVGIKKYILLMRENEDYRKDFVIKQEIYDNLIEKFFDVVLVLDDRNQVVKMWREKGLTCLQVADGDF